MTSGRWGGGKEWVYWCWRNGRGWIGVGWDRLDEGSFTWLTISRIFDG